MLKRSNKSTREGAEQGGIWGGVVVRERCRENHVKGFFPSPPSLWETVSTLAIDWNSRKREARQRARGIEGVTDIVIEGFKDSLVPLVLDQLEAKWDLDLSYGTYCVYQSVKGKGKEIESLGRLITRPLGPQSILRLASWDLDWMSSSYCTVTVGQ